MSPQLGYGGGGAFDPTGARVPCTEALYPYRLRPPHITAKWNVHDVGRLQTYRTWLRHPSAVTSERRDEHVVDTSSPQVLPDTLPAPQHYRSPSGRLRSGRARAPSGRARPSPCKPPAVVAARTFFDTRGTQLVFTQHSVNTSDVK